MATCRRQTSRATRDAARLRQSGLGAFGKTVQLEIERWIDFLLTGVSQLGDLSLELLHASSQAYYLKSESLFRCAAHVTQQGACHVATFHTTASMPECLLDASHRLGCL